MRRNLATFQLTRSSTSKRRLISEFLRILLDDEKELSWHRKHAGFMLASAVVVSTRGTPSARFLSGSWSALLCSEILYTSSIMLFLEFSVHTDAPGVVLALDLVVALHEEFQIVWHCLDPPA